MQDKVKVFWDSPSAIHFLINLAYHTTAKHIAIKYHFVRWVIDEGGIALHKVHTLEICVYMFTKPILLEKLWWCLTSLDL